MTNRLDLLLELHAASPSDEFTIFALAKEMEGRADLQAALNYYLTLKNVNPNYVGLYYHLGKLYEKLENQVAALETYRTGIEIARTARDFHAMNELAGAKMNLGDFDDEDDE